MHSPVLEMGMESLPLPPPRAHTPLSHQLQRNKRKIISIISASFALYGGTKRYCFRYNDKPMATERKKKKHTHTVWENSEFETNEKRAAQQHKSKPNMSIIAFNALCGK